MNLDSRSRLRTRLRATTKGAILEAAEEEFGRAGPADARMEDIAAAAGVAVGSLYKHFADREALARAVFDARRDELIKRLDQSMAASASRPFEERLEAFVTVVLEHFERHRALFSALFEQ